MIADLPGYGYAKVSKEAQAKWQRYLEEYLLNREQIRSLVQLVDGRHELQKTIFKCVNGLMHTKYLFLQWLQKWIMCLKTRF